VGSAEDARAYLGLAAGFMETASVGKASTEHEIRNAFSRSYYAIYHVSHGYLLASRTVRIRTGERGLAHGTLHSMMERQMGKAFGRFMRECFKLRLDSDYRPEWTVPPFFDCNEKLKQARTQFHYVTRMTQNLLSQGHL